MELAWINELFGLLEKALPPGNFSKGLQRSFPIAALVLAWIALDMVIRRPAGSWLYYRLAAGHGVRESAAIAERVAALEGEAAGLELSLEMTLRELQIRSTGTIPLPPAAVSSVGVSVTPPPSDTSPGPPPLPVGPTVVADQSAGTPPPPPPAFTFNSTT